MELYLIEMYIILSENRKYSIPFLIFIDKLIKYFNSAQKNILKY